MLRAIWELTHEMGYPPCFRELRDRLGFSSKAAVFDTLNRLCRDGWAVRENMVQRSLRLTAKGHAAIGSPADHPYIAT